MIYIQQTCYSRRLTMLVKLNQHRLFPLLFFESQKWKPKLWGRPCLYEWDICLKHLGQLFQKWASQTWWDLMLSKVLWPMPSWYFRVNHQGLSKLSELTFFGKLFSRVFLPSTIFKRFREQLKAWMIDVSKTNVKKHEFNFEPESCTWKTLMFCFTGFTCGACVHLSNLDSV